MKRYCITITSNNWAGCEDYEIVEAEDYDEAEEIAYDMLTNYSCSFEIVEETDE